MNILTSQPTAASDERQAPHRMTKGTAFPPYARLVGVPSMHNPREDYHLSSPERLWRTVEVLHDSSGNRPKRRAIAMSAGARRSCRGSTCSGS